MSHSFDILEKNLHVRVVSTTDSLLAGEAFEADKALALLLPISESGNPLLKILSIFCVYLRLLFLKPYLRTKNVSSLALYGVYPTISEPVAIYELNTSAAGYIHKNVMPAFPAGPNGSLRSVILGLTKIHPSLAGVVLLVQRT